MMHRRWHLFEFGDQPWLPDAWRTALSDVIQNDSLDLYPPAFPVLLRWIGTHDIRLIVDVGSGAGGPWPMLLPKLEQAGLRPEVRLSDARPRSGIMQLDVSRDPVPDDAALTLFSVAHHLRPGPLTHLLQRVAKDARPVAIFEFTHRRADLILGMRHAPRRLKAPLSLVSWLYAWDGAVSHLRSYTEREWAQMTQAARCDGYRWELGTVAPNTGPVIRFVLGHPIR